MTSSHQCLLVHARAHSSHVCVLFQGLKDLFFYRRESAYQCMPTTGYSWEFAGGKRLSYIDSTLPFGLRSAPPPPPPPPPKVFNAVADPMQWILEQHGVKVKPMLHCLDDFLIIGTRECKQALETALGLCRRLGIPLSVHKTEGLSDTSAGMTPDIIPTPFHDGRNVARHLRSDRKPSLSLIM